MIYNKGEPVKNQISSNPSVFHVCFSHMRTVYKLGVSGLRADDGSAILRLCADKLTVKTNENAM